MVPNKIENTEKLLQKIIKYEKIPGRQNSFEGFIHYTSLANMFFVIKNRELLSRDDAVKKGLLKKDSANSEIIDWTSDYVKGMVRLFYSPTPPFSYEIEGIIPNVDGLPHMPCPVVLVFDKDIAYEKQIRFADGCCSGNHTSDFASIETNMEYDPKQALDNFNWELILSRGPYNIILEKYQDLDWNELTNYRNAEFLYPRPLSMDKLRKIVYRCEADKHTAQVFVGKLLESLDVEQFVDDINEPYYFNFTRINKPINFVTSYEFSTSENKFELRVDFYSSNIKDFNHKLQIRTSNGYKDYSIKQDLLKTFDNNSANVIFDLKRITNVNSLKEIDSILYFIDGNISAVWKRGN